ncbi:MAG: hypothetical protein IKA02_02445 [Clostridia bacterium]|nr:hypothetical protein [Clostridia bacterium]
MLKRLFCLLLAVLSLLCIVSCGGNVDVDDPSAIRLSFKSASTFDYLKSIDGQTVTINGYMATSSPVDGSFMFLMNLPYQSCPFCVPNTSQLSNTMEVYPKNGKSFPFTNQAIKVTGKLMVAESEDKFFTDRYGYEFNFMIIDADYKILKSDEISSDVGLWNKVAESDLVTDIYSMYDYVNFLCAWNTYYVNTYTDSNGVEHKGYYLYASDALNYITKDGAQWNYGYKDGYFDNIIKKIKSIDETKLNDLVENVEKAKALAEKALKELQDGNYTKEYKYVEMFGTSDYVYSINKGDELKNEMNEIYGEFSDWFGGWEM